MKPESKLPNTFEERDIEVVEWIDHGGSGSETFRSAETIAKESQEPLLMRDVGWVIVDDGDHIVLCPSQRGDADGSAGYRYTAIIRKALMVGRWRLLSYKPVG